jgi:Ser/Thr protein kinase RdoA (MazF antagonist)
MIAASDSAALAGAQAVLARYPAIGTSIVIDMLPSGSGTVAWMIAAPAGRFLLRRLATGFSAAQARFAAIAQHRAAIDGLAPPVLTNDAGDMITPSGSHLFQLTGFASGECWSDLSLSATLCGNLGRAVGQLHRTLAAIPADRAAPSLSFPGNPAAPLLAALATHDRSGCPHWDARQVLQAKLRRARMLQSHLLDHLSQLPQQVIHGDIHPGNVFVRTYHPGRARKSGQPVITLTDFDLARYAPPAYELIRALIYCVRPAGTREAFTPRVSAFLVGYLTACPLPTEEIAAMADLFQVVQLLDTHGLDSCRSLSDSTRRFGQARFALSYWMRRHGGYLAQLACRAQLRVSTGRRPCG